MLEVQPLSEPEIESFAKRFFRVCYRLDDGALGAEVDRFLSALRGSAEAKALAGTALFLTMMLVVSRHKPLPDKRHQLYRECLTTLLNDRPDTWAREGVQRNHEWFRPADGEQRWKAVARLALELQSKGYGGHERRAIVAREADIVAALPMTWKVEDRRGFFLWLIGEAGLLTDRADGTYTFAHLSFQEYLSARHLAASVSDGNWATPAISRFASLSWWDTLLLYAAEVGSISDERADTIIDALIKRGDDGIVLAGMILADGTGSESSTTRWIGAWVAAQQWGPNLTLHYRCRTAWDGSQQTARKKRIAVAIDDATGSALYWNWDRLSRFAPAVGLQIQQPKSGLPRYAIPGSRRRGVDSPEAVGASRVLAAHRDCPDDSPEWLLLQWPSRRRTLGARLQSAILAGASSTEVIKIAKRSTAPKMAEIDSYLTYPDMQWLGTRRAILPAVRNDLALAARRLWRYWANLQRTYGYEFDSKRVAENIRTFLHEVFQRTPNQVSLFDDIGTVNSWLLNLIDLNQHGFDLHFSQQLSRGRKRNIAVSGPWLHDHLRVEVMAVDRWAGPLLLSGRTRTPEAVLMKWAATKSLGHDYSFDRRPRPRSTGIHCLWQALARHIIRESTDDDRALLTELGTHPERAEPPLSWALQFVVRGDLVLEDGSTVTLDDFLQKSGIAPLPILDEPEPIDVLPEFADKIG